MLKKGRLQALFFSLVLVMFPLCILGTSIISDDPVDFNESRVHDGWTQGFGYKVSLSILEACLGAASEPGLQVQCSLPTTKTLEAHNVDWAGLQKAK